MWEALSAERVKNWEKQHARGYEWAKVGRSSERAVWKMTLDQEGTSHRRFDTAVVADVTTKEWIDKLSKTGAQGGCSATLIDLSQKWQR